MSINKSQIDNAVYDRVTNITGLEVIWSNQNSPRPERPYLVMQYIGLTRVNDDYIYPPNDSGESEVVGNRQFTLQIQQCGGDSIFVLEELRTKMYNTTSIQVFHNAGFSIVNDNQIQYVPEAITKNRYEDRSLIEFILHVQSISIDTDIGIIDTVNVEGENITNQKTVNINIET